MQGKPLWIVRLYHVIPLWLLQTLIHVIGLLVVIVVGVKHLVLVSLELLHEEILFELCLECPLLIDELFHLAEFHLELLSSELFLGHFFECF